MQEYLDEMNEEMASALEALKQRLSSVRTGRASPQLLDSVTIHVASYGATMPLKQLCTITTPDPRLLVCTPWDKSTIPDIEKGIVAAAIGLNPSNDGQIVRVPVPALTGERRKEMVKTARSYGEESKIRIRGVRREYNELFKGMEADKEISEDDRDRLMKKVQQATDAHGRKIDEMISAKEKEILED